jgi:lipopolysaccharide biosynthesis glycosyltransferase
MDILCACDERYVRHTAAMLCSLLEHNGYCGVHVLHSTEAGRELLRLKSFVEKYGSMITLYRMIPEDFGGLHFDSRISVASYYRLLGPRFLPSSLRKILYLDSDIIVRRSLSALWDTDIHDHALAAAEDPDPLAERPWASGSGAIHIPPGSKYFNAGVMLINLDFWRRNDVPERAIAFIRNHPEKAPEHDQDALNALLVGEWIQLPATWNYIINATGRCADPAVIHYGGKDKPWHWSWNLIVPHPLKYEYHRYRKKTPWRRFRLREGRAILPWRLALFLKSPPPLLKSVLKSVLPRGVRRWLRSHIIGFS